MGNGKVRAEDFGSYPAWASRSSLSENLSVASKAALPSGSPKNGTHPTSLALWARFSHSGDNMATTLTEALDLISLILGGRAKSLGLLSPFSYL